MRDSTIKNWKPHPRAPKNDVCKHEWKVSGGDWDGPEWAEDVECIHCGVPGQCDKLDGEIYWPCT